MHAWCPAGVSVFEVAEVSVPTFCFLVVFRCNATTSLLDARLASGCCCCVLPAMRNFILRDLEVKVSLILLTGFLLAVLSQPRKTVNTNIEVLGFFKAKYLFPLTTPTLFYALFYAFVESYLAQVQKQFMDVSSYFFFSFLIPAFLMALDFDPTACNDFVGA